MITNSSRTVVHLLGYLDPKSWRDALADPTLNADEIAALIDEQERVYHFNLWSQVR